MVVSAGVKVFLWMLFMAAFLIGGNGGFTFTLLWLKFTSVYEG